MGRDKDCRGWEIANPGGIGPILQNRGLALSVDAHLAERCCSYFFFKNCVLFQTKIFAQQFHAKRRIKMKHF